MLKLKNHIVLIQKCGGYIMDKRVMAIKVRLKPSPEQIEEFHKNFGCVRKV